MQLRLDSSAHLTAGRALRPRWQLVLSLVVCAIVIFAPSVAADRPVKLSYSFSDTAVLTDACSFPIDVSLSAAVTETDFFDRSGALTRVQLHVNEQDTFAANGNSLTGVPFTFNFNILFDAGGNVSHFYADGVAEKVRLPDGRLFISAGRIDFAAHGFPTFILTPDVGATVNLAGFCAALAQ